MNAKSFYRAAASAGLAAVALASAAPASAAVVLCQDGPGIDLTQNQCIYNRLNDVPKKTSDNDDIDSVKAAIFEATGLNVDISLFGKTPDNLALFSFTPSGDPQGEMTFDWSVLDGTKIKYVTIKAANEFKLYEYLGLGAISGTVSTAGMVNNGGNQPGTSHISFWTTGVAVPEPSAWALMILGFGAVGGALRASRKQRTTLRYV